MATKYIRKSTKDRVCIDCGGTIKKGDLYYNDSRKDKKVIYCMTCKKKPEHCRRSLNHDKIIKTLIKKPLFKHEFDEKYGFRRSGDSNTLVRRLMMKGYPIIIFRWSRRSRYASKIANQDRYRKSFQPNDFIIYYIEGTENLVVKRIIEVFEVKDVRWKPLLQALYGKPVPTALSNSTALIQWANENVFKYVGNNRYSEDNEKEVAE